jgi:hypothetical protein
MLALFLKRLHLRIMRRLTTAEFIDLARHKHGDIYDYSLVNYTTSLNKVNIICKDHGVFLQSPKKHTVGQGCPDCGLKVRSDNRRYETNQFIERARIVHGDLYGYDLVEYTLSTAPVTILCKRHGEFRQTASVHLMGCGCSACGVEKCSSSRRSDNDKFIKSARNVHGDLYGYDLVEYKGRKERLTVVCKHHGCFLQTANNHLAGAGCPHCAGNTQIDTEGFIEKAKCIHGDEYCYDLVSYVNSITKVVLICNDHGEFTQSPANHLRGRGCPDCAMYGYRKSKPGILYYVRFDLPEMSLWKIGITNLTVKQRFAGFNVTPIIIRQWRWEDGSIAAKEESRILRCGIYDQYRYNGKPVLKSGNTECFTIDIMQLGNTTKIARSAA